MSKIKIAIVDDDLLIVALISEYLNASELFEVVFQTVDGIQFLDYIKSKPAAFPDVVMVDLKMHSISGLDLIAQLRALTHAIKIMVVSSHYQENSIRFMMDQGVVAFLPKGIAPIKLKDAIQAVAEQGFYWDEQQKKALGRLLQIKSVKPLTQVMEDLTAREMEVLKYLCFQKTAKEIGELLFISQRTVEGHKSNLLIKLDVKNVMGLVVFALQNNIVDLDELPLI